MHARSLGILVLAGVALGTAPAAAQEKGTVGLHLGYSGLGLLWHATDRFALRPAFTFAWASSKSTYSGSITTVSGSSSHTWNYGFAVGALFYAGKYENLRTYFTPEFRYARSTGSTTPTAPTGGSTSDITGWNYGVAGSFGAQYWLGKRFSVFGELGVAYSDQKSTYSGAAYETRGHSVGPASRLGAVFYF